MQTSEILIEHFTEQTSQILPGLKQLEFLPYGRSAWLDGFISFALLILVLFAVDYLMKFLIRRFARTLGRRQFWIGAFLEDSRYIFWICLLPVLVFFAHGIQLIPELPPLATVVLERSTLVLVVIASLMTLSNGLRIAESLYRRHEIAKSRPIKGYLQTIMIVAYLLGFIGIVAIIIDRSPLLLLSGLGALTAVLLLVFKDSILSLVAGVQLTANDLIRVGDWIEMPQFGADGDVVEIALHSVKVQNWDRTITVIPAHKFLENSFKNWRGMAESGGRRIKRSITIDVNSIRFLTEDDIESFSKMRLLKEYLQQKRDEVSKHNSGLAAELHQRPSNLRRLTNVGTFRAYITQYLKEHPLVHKDRTFLVRQLAPGPEGLPIEIYVFATDIRWEFYESIQADIFDHLLAVMPEFDLRFYQHPSGMDFSRSFSNGGVSK
ncbi:MAG: mechanosensitive ion channel [Bdellovibrionales bacterium]|jgi:miniconductance mechanosensitive channel|nr:mechanosensitive ion channel [Bdellovibrionales bacterium]